MIPDKFIRGNAEMTEEYRNFCAGAMISLGLFVALTCLALRGAALNMKNLLLILDKISDRMDAWLHTEPMLPTQATFKATDTNAVAILLIPRQGHDNLYPSAQIYKRKQPAHPLSPDDASVLGSH